MRTGRRFEEARIANPRQRFLCRQSEARIANPRQRSSFAGADLLSGLKKIGRRLEKARITNPRQRFLIVSAIVACAGCQRNGLQIRASFIESASI